ncbi:hypothetical protein RJT34_27487 [Clitoria ternatea]|uniref:RNase H type-1 domain-containing protein n=1 Tax=Clitoria ternatea TaxID=43366 RepID=A0AAN9F9V7_CLITE
MICRMTVKRGNKAVTKELNSNDDHVKDTVGSFSAREKGKEKVISRKRRHVANCGPDVASMLQNAFSNLPLREQLEAVKDRSKGSLISHAHGHAPSTSTHAAHLHEDKPSWDSSGSEEAIGHMGDGIWCLKDQSYQKPVTVVDVFHQVITVKMLSTMDDCFLLVGTKFTWYRKEIGSPLKAKKLDHNRCGSVNSFETSDFPTLSNEAMNYLLWPVTKVVHFMKPYKMPFVPVHDLYVCVRDVWQYGRWDFQHLVTVLPDTVTTILDGMHINLNPQVEDAVVWSSGTDLRWVWRLNTFEKIKFLVWLVRHDSVPTNALRNRYCIQGVLSEDPRPTRQVSWFPPPSGMVFLNVDGYSKGNPGAASFGGSIRDKDGVWLYGFNGVFGVANSLHAKFQALWRGLSLAWDEG